LADFDGGGMIELGPNRYGKRSIRLVRVVREPVHQVRDCTVDVSLEGAFEAAFTAGDNASVVATDTMKNTVYALATEHLGAIEAFGAQLARHFLEAASVARATITIREHAWEPLEMPAGRAPDAFRRSGAATRTAVVSAGEGGVTVDGGIEDLVVMKTARSAFSGFPRDRYTTLPEVRDRIMATRVTASWRHADEAADWDARHAMLVRTLLAAFADHDSESVQHSIWVIGSALLEAEPGISEVTMCLPNLHHWLVDLAPFGGASGEIYVATTEPHGQIEATVRRSPGA
jgi:urate oxidase